MLKYSIKANNINLLWDHIEYFQEDYQSQGHLEIFKLNYLNLMEILKES